MDDKVGLHSLTIRIFIKHPGRYKSFKQALLFDAAQDGQLQVINQLKGLVNLGARNNQALRLAAQYNHLEVLKYLLAQGADIRAQNHEVLRLAVAANNLEMVKYLISRGANPRAQEDLALIWAARDNRLKILKYLISQGADLRAQEDRALRWAAENNHPRIVKYLLAQGACPTSFNYYAISTSVVHNTRKALKVLLLAKNPDIHIPPGTSRLLEVVHAVFPEIFKDKYLFHMAVLYNTKVLRLLLLDYNNYYNIHHNNHSSLRLAARFGKYCAAKYLVSQGADIPDMNYDAINWAISNNHQRVVRYLIGCCRDDIPQDIHQNFKIVAAEYDRVKILRYLSSIDNNLWFDNFHVAKNAAHKNSYKVIRYLLKIVPDLKRSAMTSEIVYKAAYEGHLRIIRLFRHHLVWSGRSYSRAYICAVTNNHPRMVRFFLDCGIRNNDDLSVAVKNNCLKVIRVILHHIRQTSSVEYTTVIRRAYAQADRLGHDQVMKYLVINHHDDLIGIAVPQKLRRLGQASRYLQAWGYTS
jgi:ankyrin repeat protein